MSTDYTIEHAATEFDLATMQIENKLYEAGRIQEVPQFIGFILARSLDGFRAIGMTYEQIDSVLLDMVIEHKKTRGASNETLP